MDDLISLLPFAKETSPLVVWAVLFIAALIAAQKYWGGWFEMTRMSAANQADAASKANATMFGLIDKLNAEIDRLSRAEAKIMDRLAECEARHRTRDEEVEKLQTQVAALNVKLFRVGLGDPS